MNGPTSSNLSCPHEVSVSIKVILMKKTKEGSLLNILCAMKMRGLGLQIQTGSTLMSINKLWS